MDLASVEVARSGKVWHRAIMSRKDAVLDAIRRMPDEFEFKDAIEEIRILQRIEDGERAADEGRVRPHEDIRALIRQWAGK